MAKSIPEAITEFTAWVRKRKEMPPGADAESISNICDRIDALKDRTDNAHQEFLRLCEELHPLIAVSTEKVSEVSQAYYEVFEKPVR